MPMTDYALAFQSLIHAESQDRINEVLLRRFVRTRQPVRNWALDFDLSNPEHPTVVISFEEGDEERIVLTMPIGCRLQ